MGLFNKEEDLPSFLDDIPEEVNFESVLAWLKGLSDDDFKKAVEVATIHRQAQQNAAKALGVDVEVTTYIFPPVIRPDFMTMEDDFLDEDEPGEDLINDIKVLEQTSDTKPKSKIKS